MRQITSHIDIRAPASLVWHILSDFRTYRRWNPLLIDVFGTPQIGHEIQTTLRAAGGNKVSVRSTIVHLRESRSLYWREQPRWLRLFSTERRFAIEVGGDNLVRFHHVERVHGWLGSLIGRGAWARRSGGVKAMNTALKLRAERAWQANAVVH